MEPSLIGWEWIPDIESQSADSNAAMEPSLIGWEWSCAYAGEWTLYLPQWSPALSAGNGCGAMPFAKRSNTAAMEPSLIGWEWPRKPASRPSQP